MNLFNIFAVKLQPEIKPNLYIIDLSFYSHDK